MTELGTGEETVHEIDVANQCRIVRSRVDDVGCAAADECATTIQAAELFCLSQARRSRWCSDGNNGAGQRIQDAHLKPFPPLGSEALVCHPAREFRHALGLALAADDRLRFFCTVAVSVGLAWHVPPDPLQKTSGGGPY